MSTVASLGSSQITSQLTQAQARLQAPITQLGTEITADKAVISAWGTISGAVSTLSQSLAGISDLSKINNISATSTTSTVATATAAIGAQTGTFSLSGVKLAKPQELYSALQSSAGAKLTGGAGSLSISLANGKSEKVSVGSGSLTLNGVAAAINQKAGGVKASVIGTSTGARLVLQGSAAGSSQAFSVAGTGALASFSYTPGSAGGTEVRAQTASNATLNINGVPVTSASNTLGSAVAGVSITLAGSGSTTISVASSPTQLSSAISSVATSLNSAISTIAKETAYVPASTAGSGSSTAKAGPLLGNYTATDLSNQLMTAVSGIAASGLSAAAIGLSVSSTGAVSFNSGTFGSAFAKNPTGVQALIGKLYASLDGISKAAIGSTSGSSTGTASTGSIGAATSSLQSQITSINSEVTQLTKQNNAQLNILVQQYSAAEAAATSAQISQAYLSIFTAAGSSGSSTG
ncbi:MAG: flagellar hook protein [Rhodospirillales bacterium 20-64-7]|nr:MAG: flagellar hook protein [Rhodospirillales bacterium 20-64-7]